MKKKKRVKFETPFFTVIFWKIKRFDKDEAGIKDLIFIKFFRVWDFFDGPFKFKKNGKIGKKKEIKTPFCFGNESMPPRHPLLVTS
jgi:hypothetical protein